MKHEVVLPKFKIPGQTNWLIRGLWIAGALVVVQGAVVAGLMWKRGSDQKSSAAAAQAAAALPAAPVAAAPATPAAKAPAKSPAKSAMGAGMPTSTTLAVAPRIGKRPIGKPGLRSGKGRYYKYGKAKRPGGRYALRRRGAVRGKAVRPRTVAGVSTRGAAPRPKRAPAAGKGDAIDDILRKFK